MNLVREWATKVWQQMTRNATKPASGLFDDLIPLCFVPESGAGFADRDFSADLLLQAEPAAR